jgi:hypothetical protein
VLIKSVAEAFTAFEKFVTDEMAWQEKNVSDLRRHMTTQSLSNVCGGDEWSCAGQPMQANDNRANLGYVDWIKCPTEVFQCEDRINKECTLTMVAERLGVGCPGTPKPSGDLRVKATGRVFE